MHYIDILLYDQGATFAYVTDALTDSVDEREA
jgi:hypothetical protein